jgi:integrase
LVLRRTGFRRTDAAKLTWGEVNFQERVIKRCTQKRKKTVEVPVHPELLAALQFEHECRKPQPGDIVLLSPVTHLPMPPRKLTARIVALGKRAGVKRAHPHRFRDTLAVDLLSKGLGIYDVAKILGDTVTVIEAHYAEFVTVLRERARRAIEDAQTGLESTLESTLAAKVPVSEENKEVVAAGPVSRIPRAALQTNNWFEISRHRMSIM